MSRLKYSTFSSFWLGLSDTVNEGTFQWVDGLPLTYEEKWAQAGRNLFSEKIVFPDIHNK